ncbi:MAG: ATP-grasp domain-containing protein [Acidobacteria bacterium]|nr:ATP-grasp domain-containing protein [Acidobacteriota bacterium]MCG3193652.1 Biotin carboxylase [Thermoanaerobaculia bacterium]
MLKKVLVANRGEIAVRVVRACRDLGIQSVALFEPADRGALHTRIATECVPLNSPKSYFDQDLVLEIAKSRGCDGVHPGYGFLAENGAFVRACEEAGITFVGPSSEVIFAHQDKIKALDWARRAGFPVVTHSAQSYGEGDRALLEADAEKMGYPLTIKSCSGGRGRGERPVKSPKQLTAAVEAAQTEAQIVYGNKRVYLEKSVERAHHLAVIVIGDSDGNIVHLGEREGSVQHGNQKLLEESPSPFLNPDQRAKLLRAAVELARLFRIRNVASIEFVADENGDFFFTEVKPRIQREHPVSEMVTRIGIVGAQFRLAGKEKVHYRQEDIRLRGHAMIVGIRAEDPWRNFLPTPGKVERLRVPGGPNLRVDTYLFEGCTIPEEYDPYIAKVTAWGHDRMESMRRISRALEEFTVIGPATNLPLFLRIMNDPAFQEGKYDSTFFGPALLEPIGDEEHLKDLAVAAAFAYASRNLLFKPAVTERFLGGWHRDARRLPGL